MTSTSPLMSIRDGTNRKVSFNARDELGDKIKKLTVMMGKLAAKDSNDRRPFKPQYIKVEVLTLKVRKEVKIRETIKMGTDFTIDQAVETEDNMDKVMRDPDFS